MSIRDRWRPGGDKYEAMKADEEWEKAHENDLPFADEDELEAPEYDDA
ncbi:hypothetical protein ACFSR7_35855 [Cohnella sp. GCM10020058]